MKASLLAVILLLILSATSIGQVRIELPKRQFKANEKIPANVINGTGRTIAYCEDIGPWPNADGTIISIITPFEVFHKSQEGT